MIVRPLGPPSLARPANNHSAGVNFAPGRAGGINLACMRIYRRHG
jgi:hypothetical protein